MIDFIMEHQILSAIIAFFVILFATIYCSKWQDDMQRKDDLYGNRWGSTGRRMDRERHGVGIGMVFAVIEIALIVFIIWKLM